MKTKSELIKDAIGELSHDGDGWISFNTYSPLNALQDPKIDIRGSNRTSCDSWRPKKLRKIETNNGWKLYTEERPEEYSRCDIYDVESDSITYDVPFVNGFFGDNLSSHHWRKTNQKKPIFI